MRLALIGIGNRANLIRKRFLASGLCDVVALCEVDMEGAHTHEARYQHGLTLTPPPKAKEADEPLEIYPGKVRAYTDFRKMFDEMADSIDAVVVATPDHAHFAVTMLAMSLGKHVYVEKPLAHTFGQTQRLMEMAERHPGVVTQMGNQGHSEANYFQFKEWFEGGVIKDITRITAHMNNKRRWHGWGEFAQEYPVAPVPPGVDWEQWTDGVAVPRPFSEKLHPQEWRSWYEFGSGCFGDWGPHILDTSHRFLQLGLPHTVRALHRGGVNKSDLIYPQSTTMGFSFAARGPGLPACEITWYDGVDNIPELEAEFTDDGQPQKLDRVGKILYGKELTFQGGSHGSPLRIIPRARMMEMRRSLPSFPQKNSNHYENFLLACKGEEVARSPFGVSGPLTQVFNLGILGQRFGGELKFDAATRQITNHAQANALLDPTPRKGWEEFYAL